MPSKVQLCFYPCMCIIIYTYCPPWNQILTPPLYIHDRSSLQFHQLVFNLYYFLLIAGCGISTDLETCYTARIMALSIIPFIIVQSLKIFSSSSAERIVILIAIVVSTVFLFLYFFYQVLHSLLISFFSTRDYVSLMWILIVKVLSGAIS